MYFKKAMFPVALALGAIAVCSSMCVAQTAAPVAAVASTPETVLATFRVKPDQLAAFLKMMPEYWAALRAQHLVMAEPYVLLQGEENGKPTVVEIFSWKDHEAADHVPAEIQKYWDRMNTMVEARDGHPGIEFPEMTIVK